MTPIPVGRLAVGLAMVLALAVGVATAAAAEAQPTIVPPGKSDKGYATGDMILGRADAAVTVVEYASMTCPHCAAFHNNELPTLKRDYIEPGKVRLVFREFPLDGTALMGAMVARCAGPDRFFSFLEVLFKQQMAWGRSPDPRGELQKLAKLGGIGETAFTACLTDQKLNDEIVARRLEGDKLHEVRATPGFVVNGRTVEAQKLGEAINAALGSAAVRPVPPGAGAPAPAAAGSNTAVYIAGGVAAVIVIAGGLFWWLRRGRGNGVNSAS